MTDADCLLCDAERATADLNREIVWEDALWRLSMTHRGYTPGFGYLEPKRHVPHVTDLSGDEAATFGPVLARCAAALKEAAAADLVYVYVFGGGIPHLHVHLGPHREGDALSSAIIRGEFTYEPQPGGAQRIISKEFPELPAADLRAVIERARRLLGAG